MKKFIFISVLSVSLISCGSMNRTLSGATEGRLIKTVSVEQGCPEEKISVLDSSKHVGAATYSLDVCGERMVYKQMGTAFMEASKADKMTESMQN